MLLIAFFSDKGVPKVGLNPTIDVWEDDATHVVNAQAMVEIAGGFYKYNFAGYDEGKDYSIRADGGAGLADNDRYCFSSNEVGQVTEDLTDIKGTGFVKDTDSLVDIRPETDKIQTGIIDVPNTYKADVSGLAPANEYDAELAAIQADLDNPDQYKADVSALALEASLQLVKTETDKIPTILIDTNEIQGKLPNNNIMGSSVKTDKDDEIDAIKIEADKIQPDIIAVPDTYKADVAGLAPANEYDVALAAIQADLDNPNQYKADVAALALEATAQLIKTETDKIQPDIIGVPGNYMADISAVALQATSLLIKTEVDKIQPDIIAVPNNYKADVSNLDVAISTRSSHTAADIWAVGVRTLTSFGTLIADVWTHAARTLTSFGTLIADIWASATRTLTAGTRDAEIDAIKLETDKIQPDIIGSPDDYKADISTLALEASVQLIKAETDKIKYILGLVQENFRLKNQVYNAAGNLLSATIRIYNTAADCDADVNEIAGYTMTATYDGSGNCTSYKVTKA